LLSWLDILGVTNGVAELPEELSAAELMDLGVDVTEEVELATAVEFPTGEPSALGLGTAVA
jgi:hypothetical protein